MKRSLVAAMALGVWLSGIASAAALTYELDRPLTPPPGTADLVVSHVTAPEVIRDVGSATLEVPLVRVVGHVRHAPALLARPAILAPPLTTPPALPTRDIDEMNCASWRELDMGSGRVQICE